MLALIQQILSLSRGGGSVSPSISLPFSPRVIVYSKLNHAGVPFERFNALTIFGSCCFNNCWRLAASKLFISIINCCCVIINIYILYKLIKGGRTSTVDIHLSTSTHVHKILAQPPSNIVEHLMLF